ncbi:hypothetical protein [Antarctobacter jejuensis]|uniref:hypothetical protein n=1 Tax=Antarctobacter jejuensis TaxID=1439938 RepID=UPI003FD0E4EB
MDTEDLKAATLARLEALKERESLSAKARATCDRLIDKLTAPVRIGIFGLPGTGKRPLLNALCRAEIVKPGLDLPTLDLKYGQGPSTEAMLADGSYLAFVGLPSASILRQNPVFLRVTAAAAGLIGRRYLLIISEDSGDDLRAGLGWAASRTDLTLWCTRSWTRAEQDAWNEAPDSLRNHALLIFTKAPAAEGFKAHDWGFDTAFDIAFRSSAETDFAAERLAAHLNTVIEEATTQDIHTAHLFLQRHGLVEAPGAPVLDPTPSTVVAEPELAPPTLDEAARADLARLFQSVRREAEQMRQNVILGRFDPANPEEGLTAFEEAFDRLCDQAEAMPSLEDACPDLCTTVTEARDLALLLRIEGGAEQVGDAARLLLQVRQDIETRLVA